MIHTELNSFPFWENLKSRTLLWDRTEAPELRPVSLTQSFARVSFGQTLRLHFRSLAFLVMSEASRGMLTGAEHTNVGPDYFGYYIGKVVELLSQDDDFLPFASQSFDLSAKKSGEVIGNDTTEPSKNVSGSLFSNSIGTGLSDLKKERLKVLLRQGVIVLSPQVDEMLDPILSLVQLHAQVRGRKYPSSHTGAAYDGDAGQVPHKKLKVTESPRESACLEVPKGKESHLESNIGFEDDNGEVDNVLQSFLENDSLEFEEIVKKYSDELSETLRHMEQQLEELLDTVLSSCRQGPSDSPMYSKPRSRTPHPQKFPYTDWPMTLTEKQQLRKLVQKLPPKNLDRIAEIIRRGKPTEAQSCEEILVDLEKEDNRTLWRLYYYVEAVEKARVLAL
ncbi:uncharacterized protein LOC132181083 isoform X2 [Corylus avellana]|uniref:uncharacterized protein LOC132181083 isoform X2 n=1 Tax=Corylus avellana TaxID=13451 RepID=UPI00286A5EB0|nr:uncharacterized protein LOC132181083 isoform X2 [Corylus avellana]